MCQFLICSFPLFLFIFSMNWTNIVEKKKKSRHERLPQSHICWILGCVKRSSASNTNFSTFNRNQLQTFQIVGFCFVWLGFVALFCHSFVVAAALMPLITYRNWVFKSVWRAKRQNENNCTHIHTSNSNSSSQLQFEFEFVKWKREWTKYLPFVVCIVFAGCNFSIATTQRTFVWTQQFQW